MEVTLLVSSNGNVVIAVPRTNEFMLVHFDVSKFGMLVRRSQKESISDMFSAFDVSNKGTDVIFLHPHSIPCKFVALDVSNKGMLVNEVQLYKK